MAVPNWLEDTLVVPYGDADGEIDPELSVPVTVALANPVVEVGEALFETVVVETFNTMN